MSDAVPLRFRAPAHLDPVRVRLAWQRAAPHMAEHTGLLAQAGDLLLDRLEDIRLSPDHILNVGDRTGRVARRLQERWPKARVVSLAFVEALARQERYRSLPWRRRPGCMVGDLSRLPFDRAQFDLVVSNMALHWTADLSTALREIRRVLAPDRLLLFTVPGAETLWELHACLAQLDRAHYGRVWVRGPRLLPLQQWGDLLLSSGFVLPVMDRDKASLPFPSVPWLLRQLKAMGAGNHQRLQPKGLMGKAYLEDLGRIYASRFCPQEGAPTFTLELLFGHVWKAAMKTSSVSAEKQTNLPGDKPSMRPRS